MDAPIEILHLFVSPGHNFFGHHGRPPGTHEVLEVDAVECVAGGGLRGDRFFSPGKGHKGQVTFFAHETYERLREELGIFDRGPGVFRRNIITRGADLGALIGREFEIQGVRFAGVEECKPCYWMNHAFGPGAEDALRGRGGLRARILTDGILRR